MGKIIRLTESDLQRIIRKVIKEQDIGARQDGAMTGAAAGAIAGSLVPGVGTAVGAGVGFILGGIYGILRGSGDNKSRIESACQKCKQGNFPATQKTMTLAKQIKTAINGMGTDEDSIYDAFNKLSSLQEFCSMVTAYELIDKRVTLFFDLDDDIDADSEWKPIWDSLARLQPPKGTVAGGQAKNNTAPAKSAPTHGGLGPNVAGVYR
jgi:hypothetical protein